MKLTNRFYALLFTTLMLIAFACAGPASGQVTNTLYRMATSGRHPAATFFWLKCQAGWREVVTIDHTGGSLSDIAKLLNDE
jgi:hypothetical protein